MPLWLIAPSLLLALFIIGYPVFDLIRTATHEVNRFGQLRDFIGFGHFAELFADPVFRESLWRTLIWTFCVVLGTIAISIPVALILNEDFAGRGLARVIIMLPWAISLTMSAIVWRWALNGQFGMVNATLFELGVISEPTEWLATGDTAFPIEIAIGILVSIPFTVTVFLGGLSSLPADIYEAARIDGANRLAALAPSDAAAAAALHQHRAGAQHHLRVQLVPDHLGDDPRRPGEHTDILVT